MMGAVGGLEGALITLVLVLDLVSPLTCQPTDPKTCPVCELSRCPEKDTTLCPADVTKDMCNCCDECSRVNGDLCGPNIGQCAMGYLCVTVSHESPDEGVCQCRFSEPVCGSDHIDYINLCTLHTAGRVKIREGTNKPLHVAYTGSCHRAPYITTAPVSSDFGKDENGFLSCQASGVPTPRITWSRNINNNIELPGDISNIVIQIRGGPGINEATSWILINPLTERDACRYTCTAENYVDSVKSSANITLS